MSNDFWFTSQIKNENPIVLFVSGIRQIANQSQN